MNRLLAAIRTAVLVNMSVIADPGNNPLIPSNAPLQQALAKVNGLLLEAAQLVMDLQGDEDASE